MKKTQIPFSPLPASILLRLSGKLVGLGAKVAKAFPYLELELKQAELDFEPEQYGAIMVLMFGFYFVLITILSYVFVRVFDPEKALLIAPTIAGIFSFLIMIQLSVFPKIKVKKKVRELEKNLIFALRTILIEIKSGVSLFDAINMVASGDYGEISKEFKKTIREINTGEPEEKALEDLGANNPSLFFRRAIWQMVSGLKAGADISNVMNALVDSLTKEQQNQVRKYGSSLRLLSLMYMMLGIIVPALGLTFLIILSSFPQIEITELTFWGLLGLVVVGQFMYLGMLKTNRPNLMGD
jgi:archaeal flagellar protein FlaJ